MHTIDPPLRRQSPLAPATKRKQPRSPALTMPTHPGGTTPNPFSCHCLCGQCTDAATAPLRTSRPEEAAAPVLDAAALALGSVDILPIGNASPCECPILFSESAKRHVVD